MQSSHTWSRQERTQFIQLIQLFQNFSPFLKHEIQNPSLPALEILYRLDTNDRRFSPVSAGTGRTVGLLNWNGLDDAESDFYSKLRELSKTQGGKGDGRHSSIISKFTIVIQYATAQGSSIAGCPGQPLGVKPADYLAAAPGQITTVHL